ncbi:MAG: hypothetical protein WBW71_09150, partial [Bacteroidota bacterium]
VNPTPFSFNGEEMIKVAIVNFGKTPAQKVWIGYNFHYWTRNQFAFNPDTFTHNSTSADEFTIAPSESLVLPLRHYDSLYYWRPTPQNERQFYGKIIYFDNNGERRETVFGFQWEYISGCYRRIGGHNHGD